MSGTVTITVHSGDLQRLVETARHAAAEAVHDTTEHAVTRIRAEWPRDTGTSGDAWRAEERGDAGAVTNAEPYVPYVHDGRAIAQALATWQDEIGHTGERMAGVLR